MLWTILVVLAIVALVLFIIRRWRIIKVDETEPCRRPYAAAANKWPEPANTDSGR